MISGDLGTFVDSLTADDFIASETVNHVSYSAIPRGTLASYDPLEPKYRRELEFMGRLSEQFPDIPLERTPDDMTDLEFVRTFFMRHSPKDVATFFASLKKRIAPATLEGNRREYDTAGFHADAMFESWCDAYQLPPGEPQEFDALLFEACRAEQELAKLEKGVPTLINNEKRADPDRLPTSIDLFLKAQVKTKMECLLVPAKAGQIITLIHDAVVLRLGTLIRYMSHQQERLRPRNLWLHNKVSPADLSEHVQQSGWRDGDNTESDFTLFDSSQNGRGVAFEELKMEYFRLPTVDIDFYVELKLTSESFLGTLPVMRFSGDVNTLLGNSDFTIAVMNLRFRIGCCIRLGRNVLHCGDDFACDFRLFERGRWHLHADAFPLICKLETPAQAGFVSFVITSKGIFKKPILTNLRLHLALVEDRAHDVMASYYIEHSLLYHNEEKLFGYLTPADHDAHAENCTIFLAHRHMIPGIVLGSPTFMDSPLSKLFSFADKKLWFAAKRALKRADEAMLSALAQKSGMQLDHFCLEVARFTRF